MSRLPLIVSLLLLSALFSSCDCFGTCFEEVCFSLMDKQTGQDLVFGPAPVYKKDSLGLGPSSGAFFQRVFSDSASKTLYLSLNKDTVLLKLSSTDIDTVVVRYKYSGKNRCCPNGRATAEEVRYNDVPAIRNGANYLFSK